MKKRAFLSPRINPLVVGLVRLLLPLMRRTLFGGLDVHISPEDLARLRAYQGQRMLLLPNHPTGEEPVVLFEVSKWLGEVLNFVATRELFDLEHGFRGWVLRRTGVYSVIRGSTDRESFMTSKNILMAGKNRLVIFIEGEVSRENDTLIPFEPGVIQLAFWAQEALVKESTKARLQNETRAKEADKALQKNETLAKESNKAGRQNETQTDAPERQMPLSDSETPDYPPIYIAPIAIRYFYLPGSKNAIAHSLAGLEKAVGLPVTPDRDRYERVRAIGERIISVQEELHQMVVLPGTSLNDRVYAIKNRMLKKMELFLDLKPNPDTPMLSRQREIRNTLDRMIHTYEDPPDWSEYEKRTMEHFRLAVSEFYQDLSRVLCFLTYDEAYLRDHQTPERFIEMLRRLEKEVFGHGRVTHPRVAVVKVGEVINLKAHHAEYEADKKGFVKQVAAQLEENMTALLASIKRPKGT